MEIMFNSYKKRSNKIIKKENNDNFTVENLYYEAVPPGTPAGR